MDEKQMQKKKQQRQQQSKSGVSCFQMPLHYPKYTKEDYMVMPEWKLDGLLAEYGLSTDGDLAYKREFAMGAFLWPDHVLQHHHPKPPPFMSLVSLLRQYQNRKVN